LLNCIMFHFLFISLILLFSQNGESECGKAKDFEIREATIQRWISGSPGGGAGNYYVFKLKILSKGISFDSLRIDGKLLPAEVAKDEVGNYKGELKKGDLIKISCNEVTRSRETEGQENEELAVKKNSDSVKNPDNKKILIYTKNKLKKTIEINGFKELPEAFYQ
jgi:hypothetical protein